ncbi:MAG: nuclease, partial [Thermoproteota archaeon]|nr:nuclease [Thermoproteota archaeon]
MSKDDHISPFLEIPASMMEKMLDKTGEIGTIINDSIISIRKNKDKFRMKLQDLIKNNNITNEYLDLTTCGIDGAYVVERLLGTDLLFSCALVTEGLFTKLQKEYPPANYEVFVHPEKHDLENALLARAIMLQMEIKLAASAPYNVIYMDGSLTTALIHM